MGVGVEVLEVVDRAEAETEDDLAEDVALVLVELLDLVEASPLHVVRDQNAAAREPRVDPRDEDEGVPVVSAGEGALVLRLELVVELLQNPLAQLRGDGLGVEAGREHLREPHDHAGVRQIRLEGVGDARVLHLDGDPRPVLQRGAVDLADRGGGERLRLDLGEHPVGWLLVLVLEDLVDLLPRHGGSAGPELCELLLVDLAVLGRQEVDVDEGRHLSDLHRRAFHLAQDGGHLESGLQVPSLEALLRLLV